MTQKPLCYGQICVPLTDKLVLVAIDLWAHWNLLLSKSPLGDFIWPHKGLRADYLQVQIRGYFQLGITNR